MSALLYYASAGASADGVLTVAPIGGGGGVARPRYLAGEVSLAQARFWIMEPAADPSTWVELTKVLAATTLSEVSNTGSVNLGVLNDSPELADVNGEVLLGVEWYGEVAEAGVVGTETKVSISADGEGGEVTTFEMPGVAAILGEATVYPWGGAGRTPVEETRLFDWRASDYLDFSWPDAAEMAWRVSPFGVLPPYWGAAEGASWPLGMLWANTKWIWSPAGTWTDAPVGTCLFRSGFEVPSGVSYVVIMAAFDNEGDLYLDGQPLFTDVTDFRRAQVSDPIPVSEGGHLLAARCTNGPPTVVGANPAGFICEVHASDAAGNVDPPPSAGLLLHTDSDWRCLPYVTDGNYPGMPIGRIMRVLLYEALLRGCFPGLTVSFTDSTDTAGQPWPFVVDVATNTGRTVLDFFRDLAETYIDFRLEPATLQLHAWNKGGMGEVRPVTLAGHSDPDDPASGNLRSLTHVRAW